MRVLVINCGNATLKYKLFEERGRIEVLAGATLRLPAGTVPQSSGRWRRSRARPQSSPSRGAWRRPSAEVVGIDREVLRVLRRLPAGALHNGPASRGSKRRCAPEFRWSRHWIPRFTPVPSTKAWRMQSPKFAGVRRYGFHGGPRYVTERYAVLTGSLRATILTLHLGSGCSAAR